MKKYVLKSNENFIKFDTGAIKDLGRGRYDLLPLETLSIIYKYSGDTDVADFLNNIYRSLVEKEIDQKVQALLGAVQVFLDNHLKTSLNNIVDDLAKLFEAGAEKYPERDWEKGRPMIVYINSTLRHFFQVLNEETDENHEAAVVWNLLTCIDTIRRLPSLAYTLDIHKEEN